MTDPATIAGDASAGELFAALAACDPGASVVVARPGLDVDAATISILMAAIDAADAATASPVPFGSANPVAYALHGLLPPAPTLAAPCPGLCAISVDAVAALGAAVTNDGTVADAVSMLGLMLLRQGWRHVAAPGVALQWDPVAVAAAAAAPGDGSEDPGAYCPATIADIVGPANLGLSTHIGWAQSRLTPLTIVVDGACLDGDLHTGTQHVVLEVSRQLAAVRPDASILVAVPASYVKAVRQHLAGSGVTAVERGPDIEADVMYRPYQMLRLDELDAVMAVGRRRLVGQLDMIGFSNPFYHPSPQLFSFARNVQRELMRASDGVTFISEYGRRAALSECPDLAPARLHVVSCGADPEPSVDAEAPPAAASRVATPFVLCISATFWHKNRGHAISTFGRLAASGYEGGLVIIGPEPFYGRSTDADDEILSTLPDEVSERVLRFGTATEWDKWWLLEHADAVLYPSVLEGFGLIPFEAAAVGTPALAFAGTAPGEFLESTDATIRSWDPGAWAERVLSWIEQPDLAAAVVAEVRAIAADTTWRACAERTWDAIDSSLAQPPVGTHPQDGGPLARVHPQSGLSRTSARARFTVARLQPALGRRIRRLAARLGRTT